VTAAALAAVLVLQAGGGAATGGSMPVEIVRALLAQQPLTRDYRPSWRFDERR
jgi:hypothetical protein